MMIIMERIEEKPVRASSKEKLTSCTTAKYTNGM
jgi:hypothetical protein